MKSNYLDGTNPRKFGGRAASKQGQIGINQGGERRCGIWQNKFSGLVKILEPEEHKNVLHMVEAIALDCHFSFEQKGGDENIYTKTPLLTKGD